MAERPKPCAKHPPGIGYPNNFLLGAGDSAEIVGQLVAGAAPLDRSVDVTTFLRSHPGTNVSFLLVRPVGFYGDAQDNDGLSIVSKEGSAVAGPRLNLAWNSTNSLPPNNFPAAADDFVFTTQSVAVAIQVLANDSDPDNDTLAIQLFTQGKAGAVSISAPGVFSYTPRAGYYGDDEFLYTVNDGRGGTASASVHVTIYSSSGSQLISTNIPGRTEANIQGGSLVDSDVDEAAVNYVILKYYPAPFQLARKAYFQFDLTGLDLNVNSPATFRLKVISNAYRIQFWGLNQAYPDFNSAITWNIAQANDLNSNNLLTSGAFTATSIGSSILLPGGGTYDFTVPNWAIFFSIITSRWRFLRWMTPRITVGDCASSAPILR